MGLEELKESVRRDLVNNNIHLLDILATGQNLLICIECNNFEHLHKKVSQFKNSYNNLIEELNKKETPIKDEIIKLEERIELLKKSSS